MIKPSNEFYKTITLNDVQLASVYYPILIDLAKNKLCMTYGELVDTAKEIHPDLEYVQNAIPVSTGRKLEVVRHFTNERDLPDVTSLIISKGQGECGTAYTDHFDPDMARRAVFSEDWAEVSTEFDLYIEIAQKNVTPRKRRNRNEAKKLLTDFYKNNKDKYPLSIKNKREEIIVLLMEGFSEKESFDQVESDT